MPTHRDLIHAIRQRPGVSATVLVGADGLVIDGDAGDSVRLDEAAARTPQLTMAADHVGSLANMGAFTTAVLEYTGGYVIVSALGPDVVLLVATSDAAGLGPLLFDLRRYRTPIANTV
jgi:predicted regulator of Ras-like GTPase activity (Roadblock/LC7/MglB family)